MCDYLAEPLLDVKFWAYRSTILVKLNCACEYPPPPPANAAYTKGYELMNLLLKRNNNSDISFEDSISSVLSGSYIRFFFLRSSMGFLGVEIDKF